MTWPFENDTSAITKKLAKKSLQSEKRRNLMVVIAVALAAFLICFTGIVSTSLTQMQRNQVVDTYEAVWLGVEENDIETLKGLPEFERVGGYYMLGEELSEQGYHASYVYCDAQMMEIAKAQMELLEGRVPEKANEVVVSEYFLSTYGNNAKIGDTVTLDTESFHGDYVVTGIMDSVNEKEANRWASGFHLCLQKNECRCFCRKCSALSIPGFGNGAVHSGIVRNGADLVCMDNPQTEKTISD